MANTLLTEVVEAERARTRTPVTVGINMRFPEDLHAKVEVIARREGLSINGFVMACVRRVVAEGEKR